MIEINVRRIRLRDAARPAGQNDRGGFPGGGEFRRLIEFGKESQLANAAHDELGVLRAEVDDGDVIANHVTS